MPLAAGEPSELFFRHFNSLLVSRQRAGQGTMLPLVGGGYESVSSGTYLIDEIEYQLEWRLKTDGEGAVLSLSVECDVTSAPAVFAFAEETVRSALANALSNKREDFFQSRFASYMGAALGGEYWLRGFRFAPALVEETDLYRIDFERIVVLDFVVSAVDIQVAHTLADQLFSERVDVLCLLLDVLLESLPHQYVWVMPEADGMLIAPSERRSRRFYHPEALRNRMPRKGELGPAGAFTGSVADAIRLTAVDLITLPKEARAVFRLLAGSLSPKRAAVHACARMYRLALALRRYSASAAIAYKVAAIDAVVNSLRPRFDSVSAFVRHFCPEAEATDELLDFLYGSVRSGHFHGGAVPLDRNSQVPFHPLMVPGDASSSLLSFSAGMILRRAIGRWLQELADNDSELTPDA